MADSATEEAHAHDQQSDGLKHHAVRGALVTGLGQVASFVLRTGSMVVMARLLLPRDFGLVGMVAAFTGFLSLFRDFGLSMASITRVSVTEEQLSTLFWVNVLVGVILAGLCVAAAPLLGAFYREPELPWIAAILGVGFLFNGIAAQHRALLQRSMRFGSLAAIDLIGLVAGIAASIGLAISGFGYWSLVAMALSQPVVGAIGAWLEARWWPGWPHRRAGVRSMLWYGGTVTLNSVVVYIAYNADKVLLGRFWGAEALGLYGRAYQLITIPTDNLNFTVSQVAFPALARIQNDPARLRRYFLEGWHVFMAVVVPLTVSCGLLADDIVRVFLGSRWRQAADIFELLAPTVLVFGVVNPFGWLLMATGHSIRSLQIALMITPAVLLGYVIGLPYGPAGVATGFSCAMIVMVVPALRWAIKGTLISGRDIMREMVSPLLSAAVGAIATLAVRNYTEAINIPLWRLSAESAVLFSVYALVLVFAMNQKTRYLRVARGVFRERFA